MLLDGFLQEVINSKSLTELGCPIAKMFGIVSTKFEHENVALVDKLITCLDDEEEYIKKNASLALTVIGLRSKLLPRQYKAWSEKANRRNFSTVEEAPDKLTVYVIGKFSDEGSMIYALQPPLKASVPIEFINSEERVCIEGDGEFALKNKQMEGGKLSWNVFKIGPGSKIKIGSGMPFQCVNRSTEPLKFAIITTPPYQEGNAKKAPGYWVGRSK